MRQLSRQSTHCEPYGPPRRVVFNEDFCLNDMLNLNLFQYMDEVTAIVDRAHRELGMEKVLGDLKAYWSAVKLRFSMHETSGCSLLLPNDEMTEQLEADLIKIQNNLTSKYAGFFEDEFNHWKQTLTTVDAVLNATMGVQTAWQHLEPIFIGSADIRAQLPDVRSVHRACQCCNRAHSWWVRRWIRVSLGAE